MGVGGSVGIGSWIGSIIVLKGHRQVRERQDNCASDQWFRVSWSTVLASSKTDGKTANQPDSLNWRKLFKVRVSFDIHNYQPGQRPLPCSITVFVCFILDAVISCNFSSVYIIHEDITLGSGKR